jgi:hypothetical protein
VWRVSGGPPPRCQLKAPPSRKEREKGRAPAFVCGESLGQPPAANTTTIQDDVVTGTSTITDRNVGMYILGEQVQAGGSPVGYSRLTTSPSVPTWIIGTGSPSLPCSVGDLYSRTSSGSGTTLWECIGPVTASAWAIVN